MCVFRFFARHVLESCIFYQPCQIRFQSMAMLDACGVILFFGVDFDYGSVLASVKRMQNEESVIRLSVSQCL